MKKVITGIVLAASVLVVAPVAEATGGKKVTICHATGSHKNPYVKISVSKSAVDGHGHNDHSHHNGDIIPPVKGVTSGKNWDAAGQAIYKAGCKKKAKPPKPPTPTTQPPTPTTQPPTPTTQPPTPTTKPGPTPTTKPSPTTTTKPKTETKTSSTVIVRAPSAEPAAPVVSEPVYTG